jgi:hypothetical protein
MNGELDQERRVARQAIEQVARTSRLDLEPLTFEHQPAPPSTSTASASLDWVAECGVFIGIYHRTISQVVKDEFYAARDRNLPMFLYLKQPRDGRTEQDADSDLREFISGELSAFVYKPFLDNLEEQIVASLLEYASKGFRFRGLPEKYVLSPAEKKAIKALAHVYVPPRSYDRARLALRTQHLLTVSGPPHVGKSSLAKMLCLSLEEERCVDRLVVFPSDGALSDVRGLSRTALLIDDPFGSVGLLETGRALADGMQALWATWFESNYLVVTSRSEVLDRALDNSRLGERDAFRKSIVPLEVGDYDHSQRQSMLTRHLQHSEASTAAIDLALEHAEEITTALAFPHSYSLLPSTLEEGLRMGRPLRETILSVNEIERLVGQWFRRFYEADKETFHFLLAWISTDHYFPKLWQRRPAHCTS